MSSTLRVTRLIELCTQSINYDEQVQSGCDAFDNQMWSIIDDTGQVVMIPNIMNIYDSKLIDILAWQFHVDFYDSSRDLEFRKNLVQMSIIWHKTKGTPALIQWVLDTYWPGGATLQEWFDYKDPLPPNYPNAGWHDRYRFRVLVDESVVTDTQTENAVVALINRYKPISRWLEAIEHPRISSCSIGWAGMMFRFIYR